MDNKQAFSCAQCGAVACAHDEKDKYPEQCLYKNMDADLIQSTLRAYREDETIHRLACAVARIEKDFYCRYTRVEETIELILRQNYSLVGVASCMGLLQECRMFCRLLEQHGIRYAAVGCKIGSLDKELIGLEKKDKLHPEKDHESMCNPILQAQYLNRMKTEFNIMIGLCVGHDALFLHTVDAPTTVLIAKDRVLAHNPAAALYTMHSYYKRLKKK